MTEKMTEQLLEEAARGMQATRSVHLVPTITEPNDGMGLFEASQGRMDRVKGAQSLARLLKKAGTSAKDAKDRIQKKYELSPAELKSVLVSTWGLSAKNEEVEGLDEAKPKTFTRQEAHDYLLSNGFKPVPGSSRYSKGGKTGRIEDGPGKDWYVSIDDKRVTG